MINVARTTSEMDMGWIRPWVELSSVGLNDTGGLGLRLTTLNIDKRNLTQVTILRCFICCL